MNEIEVTELLLRAILGQPDAAPREMMIHKLWANRAPEVIASCIDTLVEQGHSRTQINATLNLRRLN